MAFEEGLFHYLDNYAGLSEEIDDRLYPMVLPQKVTLPAVTYMRVSTPRNLAFERSFIPYPRFQFDCWAESYERAKDVAAQIVAALDIYGGTMGDYTVQVSIIEDERDFYEPATKVWHSMVEAVIWHE